MNAMNEQTRAAVAEVRQTNCEFLTVPQVAKILKVNKNMVYDLISVKLLRAVKLGSTKVATIAVGLHPRDGCRTDRVRPCDQESHTAPV